MYNVSDEKLKKLDVIFKNYPSKSTQVARIEAILDQGKKYAGLLMQLCPESRELSLALTNLEQTAYYAKSAIERND